MIAQYAALAVMLFYCLYTIIRVGAIPQSLSETHYLLKQYKQGWLFPVFAFVQGILVIPYLLVSLSDSNYQFIAFLICITTVFAGVTYKYKEHLDESTIHYTSAILLASSVIILNIVYSQYITLGVCLGVATLLTWYRPQSAVFFFEIMLFVALLTL